MGSSSSPNEVLEKPNLPKWALRNTWAHRFRSDANAAAKLWCSANHIQCARNSPLQCKCANLWPISRKMPKQLGEGKNSDAQLASVESKWETRNYHEYKHFTVQKQPLVWMGTKSVFFLYGAENKMECIVGDSFYVNFRQFIRTLLSYILQLKGWRRRLLVEQWLNPMRCQLSETNCHHEIHPPWKKKSICPTFILLQYSISCFHYSFSSSPGFIQIFLHSHMILNCVILCAISSENCKWVCGLILANVINLRHAPRGPQSQGHKSLL